MPFAISSAGIVLDDGSKISTFNSLGMRNRIINGDMRIDQRNDGAAITVSSTQAYHVDRFESGNTTGTGTITVQQSTLGTAKSVKLTATVAVTDLTLYKWLYLRQIIEAQNSIDLNGKTITLSFKVETNWTGNLAIAFFNSNNTRSYVVDRPVVSGTNNIIVTLLLEADTVLTNGIGRGVQMFIGGNNEANARTTTTGSWLALIENMVSTSSTQWAKTTGNFINVTEVQLEEGSVATPFERRPIGVELALCQRYYEDGIAGNLSGFRSFTVPVVNATACHGFTFLVPKRALGATVAVRHAVNGTANQAYIMTTGGTHTITSVHYLSINGVGEMYLAASAPINTYYFNYTASSEL